MVCINTSGLIFAVVGGGALHALLQGVQRYFRVTAETQSSDFGTGACDLPNSHCCTASLDQLALLAYDELDAPLPAENFLMAAGHQAFAKTSFRADRADRPGSRLDEVELDSEAQDPQSLQAAESVVGATQV